MGLRFCIVGDVFAIYSINKLVFSYSEFYVPHHDWPVCTAHKGNKSYCATLRELPSSSNVDVQRLTY